MNKDIKLSDLKDKVSSVTLVVAAMVVLVIVLAAASFFTIKEVATLKTSIGSNITTLNQNKILVTNLKKLEADSEKYAEQQAKYDQQIADANTYNTVDYYVELDEMCKKYDLQVIDLAVGEMAPSGLVNQATTTIAVVGEEINVKRMAVEIVSKETITRIDTIAMAEQEDGTVAATMVIVNFTK